MSTKDFRDLILENQRHSDNFYETVSLLTRVIFASRGFMFVNATIAMGSTASEAIEALTNGKLLDSAQSKEIF